MEVDSSHIHNSAYSTAYRFGCRMFIAKHVQLSLLYNFFYANFKSFCIGEMKTAFALWLIAYKNTHKPTDELTAELTSHLRYEKGS